MTKPQNNSLVCAALDSFGGARALSYPPSRAKAAGVVAIRDHLVIRGFQKGGPISLLYELNQHKSDQRDTHEGFQERDNKGKENTNHKL